jgi:RNA polymerase sigma-70 factor (ECF subfamily)
MKANLEVGLTQKSGSAASRVKQDIDNELALAYLQLKHQVLGFLKAKLQDHALAEDIYHDAFVKALLLKPTADIQNPQAWLKRVMHNAMIDHFRQQANLQTHTHTPIESLEFEESLDLEVHQLFSSCLRAFAKALPEKYRDVLIAKDFEGVPVKDIMRQFSLGESAVKSRLVRARKMLKQALMECCSVELENGIITDFSLNKASTK